MEKVEAVTDFLFLGSKITADGDYSHEIKTLIPWKESYDKPRQRIKKQRYHKDPYNQKLWLFRGRSQDGRGIQRGNHFLSYKFMKEQLNTEQTSQNNF